MQAPRRFGVTRAMGLDRATAGMTGRVEHHVVRPIFDQGRATECCLKHTAGLDARRGLALRDCATKAVRTLNCPREGDA